MGKGLFSACFLFVFVTSLWAKDKANLPPVQDETQQIGRMLAGMNSIRTHRRIPAVCLDRSLARAATEHAEDMARHNYLSDHGRGIFLARSTPGTRAWANGYAWANIGETICAGSPDADSVLNSWLRSAAHLRILTYPWYLDAGIGIARSSTRTYWVVMLGRRQSAGEPPKNWRITIAL